MSSCSLLQESLVNCGVVLVKFDHRVGPLILSNNSDLEENLLMNLAIKGTTTLMSGLPYNINNTRRFRGLFQLSADYFVYGFDLVLIDDQSDEGVFLPVILFLVFPESSVPIVGSNIQKIENTLYRSTESFLTLSQIHPEFSYNLMSSIKGTVA